MKGFLAFAVCGVAVLFAGCASTSYDAGKALASGRAVVALVEAPPMAVFASSRELAGALFGDENVSESGDDGASVIMAQGGEQRLILHLRPQDGGTRLTVMSEGGQTAGDDHIKALKAVQSVCADVGAECSVRK